MNKRLLLTALLVLTVILSVSAISASEVNVTDTYAMSLADDSYSNCGEEALKLSVYESSVDNDSNNDLLESDNSNTLSTNTQGSDILTSDGNSSAIDASKTITSKDVTKYYKGSAKYTANFLDENCNPLNNTNVKITLNKVSYTVKTDKNGAASLGITLKPGTYKVVATNPKTGYNLTNTIKVLSTINAKDISKVYTDGRKFTATFLKSDGSALANKNIKFKINGKTYTRKTNSKGVAGLSLSKLKTGSFKIISYNTDGLTKTNTVKVVKSTTSSLTASDYTFLKSESKSIKVKLLNKFGYAPGKGKVIKFTINGKTYSAKTNANGIATLKLPSIKEGTYTVKYKFAGNSFYKASSTTSKVTILPSKTPTFTVKSTTSFGKDEGTSFKLALTSGKIPLSGKTVTLTLEGTNYTKTTDSNGIVSLPINLDIGNYTIKYTNKADSKTDSKNGSTNIVVKQRTNSTVTWKSATSFDQGTQSLKVLLLDSNNKAVAGDTVKLTVKSKTYTATTSSSGYATFSVNLAHGNQNVTFNFAGDNNNLASSGSAQISVNPAKTISIKNIVSAAASLKSFYEDYNKLPDTITAGGIEFTVPEFLYLMSQAIYQIGNSKTSDIAIIYNVSAPSSPSGDNLHADLLKSKYITLAKSVGDYISKNKKAPNYGSANIGKIIYSELVDSFSRILAFYSSNKRLPSYVAIGYSISSQAGTGLNEKNKVTNLSVYLISSKNCQVGAAAIKKVVDSLTKGLTSDSAKAKAIFNYVRDALSYSFYYNTKYGATGTLSAKKGNCVDHSHLLVAMFRTANIAARYVQGNCKFSSGATYGHVWTQVLIDGKWTVADATSSRNSLGSIANWNTKSFTLKGIYSEITF